MGRRTAAEQVTKNNKVRLLTLISQAYTADQWLTRFKRMKIEDQFRFWAQVEPKDINNNNNGNIQVLIRLTGITGKQAIQGEVIDAKELPEHDNDATD